MDRGRERERSHITQRVDGRIVQGNKSQRKRERKRERGKQAYEIPVVPGDLQQRLIIQVTVFLIMWVAGHTQSHHLIKVTCIKWPDAEWEDREEQRTGSRIQERRESGFSLSSQGETGGGEKFAAQFFSSSPFLLLVNRPLNWMQEANSLSSLCSLLSPLFPHSRCKEIKRKQPWVKRKVQGEGKDATQNASVLSCTLLVSSWKGKASVCKYKLMTGEGDQWTAGSKSSR